jgi:hypothetical protein
MLDSAERTQALLDRKEKEAARLIGQGKKTQRKVVKQTPGQLQTMPNSMSNSNSSGSRSAINTILNRPLSNPTAGPPPPSAADYVPSAAFLQNMTTPQNSVVYPKSVPEYLGR